MNPGQYSVQIPDNPCVQIPDNPCVQIPDNLARNQEAGQLCFLHLDCELFNFEQLRHGCLSYGYFTRLLRGLLGSR
jgi:hypothetical protein